MKAQETIRCRGHSLILGTHPTTFEITTEKHLTCQGNCIIGVDADKGCEGLSAAFKDVLARDSAELVTHLSCNGIEVTVHSKGSSKFTLSHPTDLVWRRSTFVCPRTIGILSDQVAATLAEELIAALKTGAEMVLTLTATCPG